MSTSKKKRSYQILQTMVNFNEKTVDGIGIHLAKRVNVPTQTELTVVEWNHNTNYIAIGGTNGVLKMIKLADNGLIRDGGKPMSNLQVNQTLEGHNGTVNCLTWNEVHQKLTSSDQNGLITVWSLHHDSWYEEMINNRNKSHVVGMSWCADGSKIVIAYHDGQVIVGTSDGNRIWNKDLPQNLAYTEWSPGGDMLLFGLQDGEVHLYDDQGVFIQKVNVPALDNVELETALQKDLRRDQIVSLKWYHPKHRSKLLDANTTAVQADVDGQRIRLTKNLSLDYIYVKVGEEVERKPQILIAYSHGVIQLMCDESDPAPAMCFFNQFTITCARWSPNGSFIAVSGFLNDVSVQERCCVHIISGRGAKLAQLRVPGRSLTGVSWDPIGICLALTVDSAILLSNIRPHYKWGYCGQTVIYCYERKDRMDFKIVFYETKLDEVYTKAIPNLCQIATYENCCVLAYESKIKEKLDDGRFCLQLCNSIGTAIDSILVDAEPHCIAMNDKAVVVAGNENFLIWHFNLPKRSTVPIPASRHVGKNGEVHVLDINPSDYIGRKRRGGDPISAVCIADDFFLVVTETGILYRIGLDAKTQQRYTMPGGIVKMGLNCTYKRIAALDNTNTLQFFDLKENTLEKVVWMPLDENAKTAKTPQPMDKKDVWSFKWDADRDNCIAYNEKGKMIVMGGAILEEGVSNMGYICSFRNLSVRTVALDRFLLQPDHPQGLSVMDIEVKSLRDAKSFLTGSSNLQQAMEFIEKNPHPKLWNLLAEVALRRLDIEKAEHAYIKVGDYCGLQFCKKLANVQNDRVKRADVCAYLGQMEDAEKLYLECDRRDLAIEMYKKTMNYVKVLQLLRQGVHGLSNADTLRQQVHQKVGEFYFERQKWKEARENFEISGTNLSNLIYCYIKLTDFDAMRALARKLPEGHPTLKELGFIFGECGLCEESVNCYLRCDKLKEAIDVCIQVNQWERAISLSNQYNFQDVEGLFERHTAQLAGNSERSLSAVQLYKRAGKFLEAAKLVFAVANDERLKMAECLRLKKLYVMGALLVEQFHAHKRTKLAEEKGKKDTDAAVALSGLLHEDEGVSIDDSRMIDTAWRGALAYHFFMMAQKQLYDGHIDEAMKTALHLLEYEDLLDPMEIYTLLAVSSCANRQFAICSRAFLKLEKMETASKEEFKNLAIQLFSKFPPVNTSPQNTSCIHCEKMIPDHSQFCPECDIKFPICVASGRPLIDYQFWLCPCCHHRAFEECMVRVKFCPLCHHDLGNS